MISIPKHKQLILFDGVCNLCNSSVQYIIRRDKKNTFLFAALQSDVGKALLTQYNIDRTKTDSILLYVPEKGVYSKSTAALHIAKHLGFPTQLLVVFLVVPAFIRNLVYDFIARNRYKWYGKKDHCMIPTPDLKAKFIDQNS
ncbi:thiol-disulfide oxidoreductase DCC family protein [Bizionia paragorgiae]|jgi:predicted DCC family thiol-disulfide oxidoreductase YuxK|uniref:thiol-disulfide oxidoreductase DCC family protein n=1 Tax=Bizionia paragorgiae TaxID=283786 RepID=UPI00299DD7ED|nr:thiol-disulfide oxidoreductase DCC family protein [Bizionia paragorgiae]MDX1272167.1 thiol-disulfide oxidoreductase DCC family protein [Bizionia paragorgiae]